MTRLGTRRAFNMSYRSAILLSFIGLTVLLTANASSYLPCTNAKDCKAAMAHDFSFAYTQAQNRYTGERLNIAKTAAEEFMKDVISDAGKRGEVQNIIDSIQKAYEELDQPKLIDPMQSKIAAENANDLWESALALDGKFKNLRYYERLIKMKIDFLNIIDQLWRGPSPLMQVKSDEDAAEMENIKKEFEAIGEIKSLLGSEERMAKLKERVFKFLELAA